tara:strand:- start:134 stop:436 length:303 start_codon:yes stop_codon:yes gene_type:complete
MPYVLPITVLFTLVALAIFSWKKRSEIRKVIAAMPESATARLSAWAIWVFTVITVVILFDPYGGDLSADDNLDIVMWIVFPPVVVFAAIRWYERFVKNEK